MPKSTLSARISRLEQRMGLPLLERSTRKVELREAGRLYFNRADALVSEAGLLHEQLGHLLREPQGLLRLSVPVDFTHEFIAPYLGEFCERFPLIQLSFNVTPRKVNLISERFDVAGLCLSRLGRRIVWLMVLGWDQGLVTAKKANLPAIYAAIWWLVTNLIGVNSIRRGFRWALCRLGAYRGAIKSSSAQSLVGSGWPIRLLF